MKTCPSCSEENPERARFCLACGTELAEAPAQRFRKVITLLFCDVIEAGALAGELDAATYTEVMTRYHDGMRPCIERHGGTLAKFIGDAIMSVFGVPVLREDDALRACRAALDMQARLRELNSELAARYGVTLSTRTGINTGEVSGVGVARAQNFVAGDAANTAARLQQNAQAGQIVLGESTLRLVRDAVDVEALDPIPMKGKAEPVPIFRLRAVSADAEALRRRHEAPLVGRASELELLRTTFAESVAERDCRLVMLLADAGVGKSRLVAEFCASVAADARVLRGRCLSYGEGITFWPLVEIVRQAAGISDDDAPAAAAAKLFALAAAEPDAVERVASVVGFSEAQFPVDEVFWGTRKLLEELAVAGPLVLVLDDIHWAEPTFLDLVEHLVDTAADVPLFLLCAARHDLAEQRPAWRERAKVAELPLRPLSDAEAGLIIANHLGDVEIGEDARARIVAAAEGNPLFVEQMLSMLIDDGILRRVDGRLEATRDLAQLAVPPSIQALLAARVDRLPSGERAVVEPAAVVGLVFSREAVEELTEDEVRGTVSDQLVRLAVKELVRRADDETAEGDAFRFGHVLIRDAAYEAALKERRALLHERVADWTERVAGDRGRLLELEELLGYHLEQAHRYRAELGPLDEHGRELGFRAAQRLGSAGRRAFNRNDMRAAAGLLGRAAVLLPADDAGRLRLLPVLGEALLATGDFGQGRAVLDEAIVRAATAADASLEAEARLVKLVLEAVASGIGWTEAALPEIRRSMDALERAENHAGLATGWRVLASVHATACRYGEATRALDQAVRHARLAGDRRQELRDTAGYAQAMLLGPTPVEEAVRECERILADASGDRRTEAFVNRVLAPLLAMQGEPEAARARYVAARAIFQDIGIEILAASMALESGRAEMIAGNLEAAERELRRDYEALERIGETYWRSTIAGLLGLVLAEQGRDTGALELAAVARELATEDDVYTQVLWRRVRAKVLARAGEEDEALRLGQEAVELSRGTDDLNLTADSLVDLAGIAANQLLLEHAVELYVRKGNVVSARAARVRALPVG